MSQEIVCQTCGDRGFPEALNYCIMCMETAEHTYCLEKLPAVLNDDIYWTCEICLSKTVGDSSLENSVLTVDLSQCNGTCEEEALCLRKQKSKQTTACSANKNAVKTTESTTYSSQTRPKRVRNMATTNTESTTYSSQTRPKRVRNMATTNIESTTYSTQTRSKTKRIEKTATTNTESTTYTTQTRSKTQRVKKTVATYTQPKVASPNKTRPALRKRRG